MADLRMNLFRMLFLLVRLLLVACSPSSALTPLPYADDFSNPASGWKTVNDQALHIRYQDGALHFTIDDLDQIVWSIAGKRFENFTLDVDATQVAGPSDNNYGVLIRYVDEKNFYRLDISGDGYFAINKYQAGKWIKLQDWTESAAIKREAATNHLQVIATRQSIHVGRQRRDRDDVLRRRLQAGRHRLDGRHAVR